MDGMMMRLAIPALLLLTGCDSGAGRDEEKTAATAPDGYREAAAALDTAIAAKDAAALEKLIADDFLWVRGSGEKGDKAGFIAALTAPAIKIEPFQPSEARDRKSTRLNPVTNAHLVCRLLLEKKNPKHKQIPIVHSNTYQLHNEH